MPASGRPSGCPARSCSPRTGAHRATRRRQRGSCCSCLEPPVQARSKMTSYPCPRPYRCNSSMCGCRLAHSASRSEAGMGLPQRRGREEDQRSKTSSDLLVLLSQRVAITDGRPCIEREPRGPGRRCVRHRSKVVLRLCVVDCPSIVWWACVLQMTQETHCISHAESRRRRGRSQSRHRARAGSLAQERGQLSSASHASGDGQVGRGRSMLARDSRQLGRREVR